MVDPDKFSICQSTEYIMKYWSTYPQQDYWQDYGVETFFHDSLYGLGVSLDREKYQGASGFKKFQNDLLTELTQRKLRGEI